MLWRFNSSDSFNYLYIQKGGPDESSPYIRNQIPAKDESSPYIRKIKVL